MLFYQNTPKTRNNTVEMVRGLVRLVRPCSMYVGIFSVLVLLVRLVQP